MVISVGSGFSASGYTIVASEGAAAELWHRCFEQVLCPASEPYGALANSYDMYCARVPALCIAELTADPTAPSRHTRIVCRG